MRAQQIELECLQIGLGNPLIGQLAETGVDALDCRATLRSSLHKLCAGANIRCSRCIKNQRFVTRIEIAQLRKGQKSRQDVHASDTFKSGVKAARHVVQNFVVVGICQCKSLQLQPFKYSAKFRRARHSQQSFSKRCQIGW